MVKRSVWRYARSGRGYATTLKMFYEVTLQRNPNIYKICVGKSQIVENQNEMKLHWSNAVPIANTQTIHSVIPKGPCHLLVAEIPDTNTVCKVRILKKESGDSSQSSDEEETTRIEQTSNICSSDKLKLHLGDWIVVSYQGKMFPGEITEFEGAEIRVNVVQKSGKFWKWPSKRDEIFYYSKNVVKKNY